ncbi:MAG: LPS-assembly protein LptD [Gammaproteobacteria bacterium]|nr:LPS-assembly protein LptD [Gammaproteobacteria bacterium]
MKFPWIYRCPARGILPLLLLIAVPVSAQESGGFVCLPDALGSGWVCEADKGQRQDIAPEPKATKPTKELPSQTALDKASVVHDPLAALSKDSSQWYTPASAKPVLASHKLSDGLAETYYVLREDSSGQCSGTYQVRQYPHPSDANNEEFVTIAEADALSSVVAQSTILTGNVTVEQGNRMIVAPVAKLDQQTRIAEFSEGVRIDQPGLVMQGARATVDLNSKKVDLSAVEFLLTQVGMRGEAESISQSGQGDLTLLRNEFTRCEPGNNGWRLNTKSFSIKKDAVFGTARHAVLRLKSVPVFYSPSLTFPVSDERLSGFLFPNLEYSDNNGVDVSVPYYLNLAPNYDATIIPRYISRRGAGVEAELRYLSSWQTTAVSASMLPADNLYNGTFDRDDFDQLGGEVVFGSFDPAGRWLGSVDHKGRIGNFRTLIDYTSASDRDYFRDLGSDLGVSSRIDLERRGEIQYRRGGLFMRLWAQRFQKLDNTVLDDYERLPEFDVAYTKDVWGPLNVSLAAQWAEFDRDTNGLSGVNSLTGSRTHFEPRLTLPFSWPFAFFKMTAAYRYTRYDLDQAVGGSVLDDRPDRGIGMGSLDGGLFFEREMRWFGQNLVQTLEPRLYYLRQEFEEQANLPRFDVSALTFSYNQLFRENRFSGIDRIADANQASAGVTTRFLSRDTGVEYFRFSVGEIFYFEDRRVTLAGRTGPNERQSTSALAAEVSARLVGNWRITGNVVWDPHDNQVDEGGLGIQYRSDNRHIFNVGFRNRRDQDIEQTDISLYWPISKRFGLIGRWNYDLVSGRTIEGFGGLEYGDCCLKIRLLARRFLDSRSGTNFADVQGDEGIFLQIVFKGLAGWGTKVESVLENGIRGYRAPLRQSLGN